jgi:hypothetical protein
VLAEGSGDVRVALSLAELGVAEDLLHDADADALIDQQGSGSVASIVDSRIPEARRTDE